MTKNDATQASAAPAVAGTRRPHPYRSLTFVNVAAIKYAQTHDPKDLEALGDRVREYAGDPAGVAGDAPKLTVWYGAMPESNGRTNWTAILHRKDAGGFLGGAADGITIARSEYPDRVRYEADRMRHLIGELADEPDILAYDTDKCEGVAGDAAPTDPENLLGNLLARIHRDGGQHISQHGWEKAVADAEDKVVAWLQRDDAAAGGADQPVAYLVTFPNEPELGHYLTEERPDSSLGVVPLYARPSPAAAPAQPAPRHLYREMCPDEMQPDARDPDCPACSAMAAPAQPVGPSELTDERIEGLCALLDTCAHDPARPEGCYRVRCQLGKRCVAPGSGHD